MLDVQRSFAAGEVAPAIYGRADVARYASSLRTCRNFVVRKEGGLERRAGSQFITEVASSEYKTVLMKFVFNDEQTYIIEAGAGYLRFIKNGALVTVGSVGAWNSGTAYGARSLVSHNGVKYYALIASTNQNPETTTAYWHALEGDIYEIPTSYTEDEIAGIQYEQSGDVITLAHPSHHPLELARYGDTDWGLSYPVLTADPFTGTNKYPSSVTYYQQRRIFARTNEASEYVWMSKIGDYYDFTEGVNDADAFSFQLAGHGVNQVRHLIGTAGRFFVLTSGGSWLIAGDSGGALIPTAPNARQHGPDGASEVRPALAGSRVLYVQQRGGIIREVQYDLANDSVAEGRDLTVYSSHLFRGHTIVSMDYQRAFNPTLWCVRDDGVLLGLTYMPEQGVYGWHRHDTDGVYEWVCVVPEGDYDAVYVVVRRTIGGVQKRYIERIIDRNIVDISDSRFVDSWLGYDGTNTGSTTLTVSGSAWTSDDTVTITASASIFTAGDIGNALVITRDGASIAFRIRGYTNGTTVTAKASKNIPENFRNIAVTSWSKAVDVFSGLEHLEGKTVSILADGAVFSQEVVTGGAVTLDYPASQVVVGLSYDSIMTTLDLEPMSGGTFLGAGKQITGASLLVDASRGLAISTDDGVTFDLAYPVGFTQDDYAGVPVLSSGVVNVSASSHWNSHGRVTIKQDGPLPLTILSIAPTYNIGGNFK